MGVAGGGLGLGVAERFSGLRQVLTDGQAPAGKGMSQVMDADIVEPGGFADPAPTVLKVLQVCPGFLPMITWSLPLVRLMDLSRSMAASPR